MDLADGNAVAELLHDQRPDPEPFMAQAKQELANRLREGKSVAGLTLLDVLDTDLNSEGYKPLTAKLASLLMAEHGEHGAIADQIRDQLIEGFLSRGIGEEAVQELAAEISISDDRY